MGVSDRLRFTDAPLRDSNFCPERRHTRHTLDKLSARAMKFSANTSSTPSW